MDSGRKELLLKLLDESNPSEVNTSPPVAIASHVSPVPEKPRPQPIAPQAEQVLPPQVKHELPPVRDAVFIPVSQIRAQAQAEEKARQAEQLKKEQAEQARLQAEQIEKARQAEQARQVQAEKLRIQQIEREQQMQAEEKARQAEQARLQAEQAEQAEQAKQIVQSTGLKLTVTPTLPPVASKIPAVNYVFVPQEEIPKKAHNLQALVSIAPKMPLQADE
jgi:multidrug efflux pump subunit AcrA (membrane-fusion protein)